MCTGPWLRFLLSGFLKGFYYAHNAIKHFLKEGINRNSDLKRHAAPGA